MTPRKTKGLTPRARRMGATETRTKGVLVRLTATEELALERAAMVAGLPLATWIRRMALDAEVRMAQDGLLAGPSRAR